jgi:hypothetical protein
VCEREKDKTRKKGREDTRKRNKITLESEMIKKKHFK